MEDREQLKKGLSFAMPDPVVQGVAEVRKADGTLKIEGEEEDDTKKE